MLNRKIMCYNPPMAELTELYEMTKSGRHREASKWIFRAFDELLRKQRQREIYQLVQDIDTARLTSFELKTLMVAVRPLGLDGESYGNLRKRVASALAKTVGNLRTDRLLKSF